MPGYLPNDYVKPGQFEVWVPQKMSWGTPCEFNSGLTSRGVSPNDNAKLTIYLRLYLIKRGVGTVPRADANGRTFLTRNWSPLEFESFRDDVKSQAEKYWDQTNFCLVPPSDYKGLDWPHNNPQWRPNVDCHFEIVWAAHPSDAHAVIDCYRPDSAQRPAYRSNAGSGQGSWTSFDTKPPEFSIRPAVCDNKVFDRWADDAKILPLFRTIPNDPQIVVDHEVGHLIGLPHVGEFRKNQACQKAKETDPDKGADADSCYDAGNADDCLNIMGRGMNLASWNALPWARSLAEHTGTTLQGWAVTQKKLTPRKLAVKTGT
jgi:hypothetical protein